MTRRSVLHWPYLAYMAALAVVMLVAYCAYPYVLDDLWFRRSFSLYLAQPSISAYWHGLKDSIETHFLYDNSRLFNTIAASIIVLPRCITGAVCAAFAVAMCWLAAVLAGCWKRRFLFFALSQAALVFVLPWYDSILVVMFAFNYVGVSVVFLLTALWLLKNRRANVLAAFMIGLISGLCHEAFTVALVGGSVALFAVFKRWRTGATFMFAAGLVVALYCLMVLSPGAAYRFSDAASIGLDDLLSRCAAFFPMEFRYTLPVWCLWTICAALFIIPSTRRKMLTPTIVFLFASSVAAWFPFAPYFAWRASWPIWLASIILGIVVARTFMPRIAQMRLARLVGVLCLGLVLAHMVVVDAECLRLRREYNALAACLKSASGPPVFAPLPDTAGQTLLSIGKVNNEILFAFNEPFTWLVPDQLENFDPAAAVNIGIEKPVWLAGRHLVIADDGLNNDYYQANIRFGNWNASGYLYAHPFANQHGRFVYLSPWSFYIASRFGTPARVSLTPIHRRR